MSPKQKAEEPPSPRQRWSVQYNNEQFSAVTRVFPPSIALPKGATRCFFELYAQALAQAGILTLPCLANGLQHKAPVQELIIHSNIVDDASAAVISWCLSECVDVRTLVLMDVGLQSSALFGFSTTASAINSIRLAHTTLKPELLVHLFNGVPYSPFIYALSFHACKFCDRAFETLCLYLSSPRSCFIHTLMLNSCDLSDRDIARLSEVLALDRRTVELSRDALSDALSSQNCSIKFLDVSYNNFTELGVLRFIRRTFAKIPLDSSALMEELARRRFKYYVLTTALASFAKTQPQPNTLLSGCVNFSDRMQRFAKAFPPLEQDATALLEKFNTSVNEVIAAVRDTGDRLTSLSMQGKPPSGNGARGKTAVDSPIMAMTPAVADSLDYLLCSKDLSLDDAILLASAIAPPELLFLEDESAYADVSSRTAGFLLANSSLLCIAMNGTKFSYEPTETPSLPSVVLAFEKTVGQSNSSEEPASIEVQKTGGEEQKQLVALPPPHPANRDVRQQVEKIAKDLTTPSQSPQKEYYSAGSAMVPPVTKLRPWRNKALIDECMGILGKTCVCRFVTDDSVFDECVRSNLERSRLQETDIPVEFSQPLRRR